MQNYIIRNAKIVNEGKIIEGDVLIKNKRIEKIGSGFSAVGNVKEIFQV